MLAFFHELGHSQTIEKCLGGYFENFTDSPNFQSYKLNVEMISCMELSDKDKSERYWNLDIEKSANLWAIDYINNNPDIVKTLWDIIQPYIQDLSFKFILDQIEPTL